MTDRQKGKQALLVIGMHRSGTSATTGALQCLGVQLGRRLYSGHAGINAKGYFEHGDIADANDEALLAMGSSWDDVLLKDDDWWHRPELARYADKIRRYIRRDFSSCELWGVKDPRVCRLLPWWLDILRAEGVSPRFLFVVRSPDAVFRSLERRDGFSVEKSYLLWTLHYLEAERWSRGYPRAFVGFDRFLEDPVGECRRMQDALNLEFPVPVDRAVDCLGKFLSHDLRHHRDESAVSDEHSPVLAMGRDLYVALDNAARYSEPMLDQRCFDEVWLRMVTYQREACGVPFAEHMRGVARERGDMALTIHRLVRSFSWYTGKPVRFVERLFNRDV